MRVGAHIRQEELTSLHLTRKLDSSFITIAKNHWIYAIFFIPPTLLLKSVVTNHNGPKVPMWCIVGNVFKKYDKFPRRPVDKSCRSWASSWLCLVHFANYRLSRHLSELRIYLTSTSCTPRLLIIPPIPVGNWIIIWFPQVVHPQ